MTLNLPQRLSASQYRCLTDCWRKYLYRYGLGIKDANADVEYFVIGRVFDDLVHGTESVETVDLRPLDESKKNYREMLKGMLESIKEKLDTSKLCCPEFEIKTITETMRIDGIYVDGDDWWIVEIKTPSARGFNLEQKKDLLTQDPQISGYFSRIGYIADHLMLETSNFKGCKYFWCLKPSSLSKPKYETHVWEITADDIGNPHDKWRKVLAYCKFAQDGIKLTYSENSDPFDVPMNASSCVTMTGACGYYEQCYKRKPAKVGDSSE